MESMVWYVEQLKLNVTEAQMIAGRYLESRGLKFCIDFGYENVIEFADTLFAKECELAMLTERVQ